MQDGSSYVASLEAETEIRRQYINAFLILYHSSPCSCDSPVSTWLVWSETGSARGHVFNPKDRLSLWAGAGETPQAAAIRGGQKWGELNYADTCIRNARVLEGFPGGHRKAHSVGFYYNNIQESIDWSLCWGGRPVTLIARTFSSSVLYDSDLFLNEIETFQFSHWK